MATILVVDDTTSNRDLLTTLLGYKGHQMLEAADGVQGLTLARAHHPDLIITDILMPNMDGYEFVRELRADPETRSIPVAFYSATYLEREMQGLAKMAGVTYMLTKPVEPQQILAMVDAALRVTPAAPAVEPSVAFDREHLRVVNNKLSEKAAELTAANERLTALLALDRRVALQRDANRLLQDYCAESRKLVGAKHAAIGIASASGDRLERFVTSGAGGQFSSPLLAAPIRSGIVENILHTRAAARFRNLPATADASDPGGSEPHAFLGSPIATADGLYGVLYFVAKLGLDEFTESDEVVAATLGNSLGIAYENLLRYEQIRRHTATLEHEVAQRQEAEAAVRDSERRFRALIEQSADALILVGADNVVHYRSPANARIRGYRTLAELSDVGLGAIHPDDLPILRANFAQIAQQAGASVNLEMRIRHRDGSWRWTEGVCTNLIHEPSVQSFVINFRDVTERRQAQEALRNSEARYRQLIKTSQEGIGVIDALGRVAFVNPRMEELLGYTADEQLGKDVFDFIAEEDKAIVATNLGRTRAGFNEQLEFRLRRKDGSTVWVLVESSTLHDETGAYSGVLAMFTDITARKRLEGRTQRQFNRLAALRAIDLSISGSLDLRVTLEVVMEEVAQQLEVDAVDLLLMHPAGGLLVHTASHGFRTRLARKMQVHLGEGHAGRVALERRVAVVSDLPTNAQTFSRAGLLSAEGFVSYAGAPLIAKGRLQGVLEVFNRSAFTPDEDWLEFLEALAGQAAIAIDNSQLFEGLQRSNSELTLAYESTIEGWSRALDLRDKETEGHTQRVTGLTIQLADAMGISPADLVHVSRGALLHDIGKMGVPDGILLKPGPLTDEEWVIMRKHPQFAYDLLSQIAYLRPALDIPYCHHEKWDGTGYPRGLKGEQIPLSARIFAVVDVWDALCSNRPYRAAWPVDKVRAHIQSLSGTHFEPKVVDAFLNLEL